MSEINKHITAENVILSELPDGERVLRIYSKTGKTTFIFNKELWKQLSETATWFYKQDGENK